MCISSPCSVMWREKLLYCWRFYGFSHSLWRWWRQKTVQPSCQNGLRSFVSHSVVGGSVGEGSFIHFCIRVLKARWTDDLRQRRLVFSWFHVILLGWLEGTWPPESGSRWKELRQYGWFFVAFFFFFCLFLFYMENTNIFYILLGPYIFGHWQVLFFYCFLKHVPNIVI